MSKQNRTDYRQQQNQRHNTNQPESPKMPDDESTDTVVQSKQDTEVTGSPVENTNQVTNASERGMSPVFTHSDEAGFFPVASKEPEPEPVKQKQASKPFKEKNVVAIEQQLVSYIENVTPSKSNTPAMLGQWQKSLFQLLTTVLNHQDPAVFRKEWTTVLNVANKNRDSVFHENYIFRAPQHWGLSDQEGTLFRRILSVILETAKPDNRAGLSNRVLLERATEGMNDVAKNNFLNYYA